MKITDEMIEAFGNAWTEAQWMERATGEHQSGSKRRAGLEAVLPLIEAEIAQEVGRLNGHLGYLEEILDNVDGEVGTDDLIDLYAMINVWKEGR